MKASLKTFVLSALGVILTFSAVTYNSCTPDKCKSIRCAYGGVCTEGNCRCQSGYQGTQCETVTRDKFLGTWTVFESGTLTGQPAQYSVSVVPGDNITDVKIVNFYNLLVHPITGYVKGDSIIVKYQSVDYRTFEGYGYLSPDKNYNEHGKMLFRYYIIEDSTGRIDDYGLKPEMGGKQSEWNK